MIRKGIRYSFEEKLMYVNRLLADETKYALANNGGPSEKALRRWMRQYRAAGPDGLKPARHHHCRPPRAHHTYTRSFKESVVREYLAGGTSYAQLCAKYDIAGDSVIQHWVFRYTSGQPLKTTGRWAAMVKSRKTTYAERIEIVQWTIAHELDYNGAAKKFAVSYSQIYGWVRKFKKDGEKGLRDRRGRNKPVAELTSEERLILKNKQLQAQLAKMETENALLKKLNELERRDAAKDNIVPFKKSPKR